MSELLFPFYHQKVLHLSAALEKKTSKISGEYIITEKYDGWWACTDYKTGLGFSRFHSSSGRVIPAFDWMIPYLNEWARVYALPASCRFIGEMTLPDTPFHTLNGRFNRKTEQCEDAIFMVHDLLDMSSGIQGLTSPAITRMKIAEEVIQRSKCKVMQMVPRLDISSKQSVWERHFRQVTDEGGEGIILKSCLGHYLNGKQTEALMKLKTECTADLLCIGIEESYGKKGEPSMNLQLQRKNGTTISVVVPKDSDRLNFKSSPTSVLGKVCTIIAMRELENGMYREPRFHHIRHDKLVSEID